MSYLSLQGFERVSTWADEQSNKVDIWVFLLRYHHLVVHPDHRWSENINMMLNGLLITTAMQLN